MLVFVAGIGTAVGVAYATGESTVAVTATAVATACKGNNCSTVTAVRSATATVPTVTVTTTATTTVPYAYAVPGSINDTCATDDTAALLAWIATVPDNSTLLFGAGKCYRVEGTLELTGRTGLVFDGNGSTFESFNPMVSGVYADDQRAMWRVNNSSVHFENMTIHGAYAYGGVLDESLQHAHGIDLRGTAAEVGPNVTVSDVAGDGVYFGVYSTATQSSGSVHDSTITRTGRQAVSLVAARNVTVQHVAASNVGLHIFDVEPNAGTSAPGVQNATFDSNTISGTVRLYVFAIVEDAPESNISFTNNTITGQLKVGVVNPSGLAFRPQTVLIDRNTSTAEGNMDISNVDGLTVTNNTVAPASISIVNCTSVVIGGNT
jgi:hypothetical protein